MFIKKIPSPEQSLMLATSSISSYRRAIEELVYNAIDAESTSIAVRVHIENTSIQVIDNGCGITKNDLCVFGQRYMTSKYNEKSSSKSVANKYGYRGEALSNIVGVSKIVRITSRCESSDATWEKCFNNGRSGNIVQVDRRPSKGTSVEIKGFLQNLKIHSKSINQLNELQKIKLFLERIALVRTNISLSLRDDSRNEIILQLHKKRDVYQTITHLYGVDKSEIQELKVEKYQYAVTAFISKGMKDISIDWIYLNQKYVNSSSRLHKIVNGNLNKCLNNTYNRKKSKIKYYDEEMYLLKNKLPIYILFIHCPITDYDIIDKGIEFNKWDQITKLLEKLAKFYVSDTNFKAITTNTGKEENANPSENTREQVRKIMNKILSSNSKNLGISQMQNGIKGKITKRKYKQKTNCKLLSQNKLPAKDIKRRINNNVAQIDLNEKNYISPVTICNKRRQKDSKNRRKNKLNKPKAKIIKKDVQIIEKNNRSRGIEHFNFKEIVPHVSNKKRKVKSKTKDDKNDFINDSIIRRFINPTESVIKRCEILAQKAQEVLNDFNNRRSYECDAKCVQYDYKNEHRNSIDCAFKNREYKRRYNYVHTLQNRNAKLPIEYRPNNIRSNYDLLNTILNTQPNNGESNEEYKSVVHENKYINYEYKSHYTSSKVMPCHRPIASKLTYESHKYEIIESKISKSNKQMNLQFISKVSKDNFLTPNDIRRPNIRQRKYTQYRKERQYAFFKNNNIIVDSPNIRSTMQNIEEYSQNNGYLTKDLTFNEKNAIENINEFLPNFSLGTYQIENLSLCIENTYNNISENMNSFLNNTYNLCNDVSNEHSMYLQRNICFDSVQHRTVNDGNDIVRSEGIFTGESNNTDLNKITSEKDDPQIGDISNSQDLSISNSRDMNYAPMDMCEAVYLNNDVFEKEFQISFNSTNGKDLDANENVMFIDKDKENYNTQINIENTSHHFSNTYKVNTNSVDDKEQTNDPMRDNHNNDLSNDTNHNEEHETIEYNTFDLKNRLHFVPKGMSQIFKNCNTRNACHYNVDTDHYRDSLYRNFVNEVQINSEIYAEQVQNVQEDQKIKCKYKTNVAFALNFDGKSLEDSIVLNQVDNKFIATIIKGCENNSKESLNFLVLFDQHAVDERIRLENNLSEYVVDGYWKSVSTDNMTMQLPNDDILYLHNYKEKFGQLGLHWTMSSNNEIQITAIPEAILGKNPRQVDKIMNAVRNLITEQINNIKSQNGCTTMYPKSIMDLVFSEACRYAVMFGDKLSKDYCVELLKALSKCKKPFQCAHGRPVMAVLMDLEHNKQEYKANLAKLKCFKQRRVIN